MPARTPARAGVTLDTTTTLKTAQPNPGANPRHSRRRPRRLPRPLSLDEVRALYSGSEGELHLLIDFLYSTGARISEALGVEWTDIDWDDATVRLMGKGKVERIVPWARPCQEALAEARGVVLPAYGLLFRLTSQNARDRLAALGKRLGFHVHPHQLRHSYATHMMVNGANERVIQILLGHADPNTSAIYMHTDPRILEKGRMIADAMSAIRGGVDMRRLRHTLTGLVLR